MSHDNLKIFELDNYIVVRASGEDAFSFLQGQLSNDLNEVTAEHSQLSAYCNPKGRVLAVFRVVRQGENYLLITPSDIADQVIKRLRMFVMRARVTIESDMSISCFGLTGESGDLPSDIAGLELPQHINSVSQSRDLTAIRIDQSPARFLLITDSQRLPINRNIAETSVSIWQQQNILAGLSDVFSATYEAFIPQDINLDLIGAVSFTKGCYPGQEIVARLHYRGTPKNRMLLGHAKSNQSLQPGDPVFSPDREQKSGLVVNAVSMGKEEHSLLVSVPIKQSLTPDTRLIGPDGPEITFEQLPYSDKLAAA